MGDPLSRVERFVYERVKNNRPLKALMRDSLQRAYDLRGPAGSESVYPIREREGFFFGFHDKCPWSSDGTKLLAHHCRFDMHRPGPRDVVDVGFFTSTRSTEFVPVAETSAWNWHQGAMLQWVGDSNRILFNDCAEGRHVARVVDCGGRLHATLPTGVAAVSPDGGTALGYSFARLRASPYGYGYSNGKDPDEGDPCPCASGIEAIDIPSGRHRNAVTVADVASIEPEPTMSGAFHYLTHCQFSPSGTRFLAFHCWLYDRHRVRLRMFTCSTDGQDLHVFGTSGMVSHACWRDDEWVLAYARTSQSGDGYYLFRDGSREFLPIGVGALRSDGHPSFSPDGRWIVTDTYPDRHRRRQLMVLNVASQRTHTLAALYSPPEFSRRRFEGMLRCDLHPRWNRSGNAVCFDSTHTGTRALCTMEIGSVLDSDTPPEPQPL